MQTTDRTPFRRLVFYACGYDPRGVRFLHGNCQTEGAKWSGLSGIPVTVGTKKNCDKLSIHWSMGADHGDRQTETDFEFMLWDNIIRENWEKREWMVYLQSLLMPLRPVWARIIYRTGQESWPFNVSLLVATGAALIAILGFALALLGLYGLVFAPSLFTKLLSVCGILIGVLLYRYVSRNTNRFRPTWLERTFLFIEKLGAGRIPNYNERMDALAGHMAKTIGDKPWDEILVVGHSYGATVAATLTARLLKLRPELAQPGSVLSLVTLGHVMPLLAWMPKADWHRDEIKALGAAEGLTWYDFSSPPDGACYAQCNILDLLEPGVTHAKPVTLNTQFHKGMSAERMQAARRERMIMHFFYLDSPDFPAPQTDQYDFFALLLGGKTVGARFSKRKRGESPFKKGHA